MSGNAGRLKVLFLPAWYPSQESPVGGIFVREHAMAASLYDDVVVVYVKPATKKIHGLYTMTDRVEDGIRTVRVQYRRIPISKTNYLLYAYTHWAVFRRLKRQGFLPDIIHAHIYYAGVPAVLLGRLYGIPVVITEQSSAFPRRLLRRFQVMQAKFAMKRACMVLPVSRDLRRHVEAYGIRAQFQVVPNTVATDLFHPDAGGERARATQHPKRLLTVALLAPVKGIPCLLEALQKLRERRQDFVLDIVGDGEPRAEYEALAATLGLADVVSFHGLKPKPEVAEFMRRCDIFVLPSLMETFSVVLIEAMASGKPIVATDVGAIPELVTDEVGRLVPPGDPDGLAETLDSMLNCYEEYNPAYITEYAVENYSYEVVGRALNEIYRTVLTPEHTGQNY